MTASNPRGDEPRVPLGLPEDPRTGGSARPVPPLRLLPPVRHRRPAPEPAALVLVAHGSRDPRALTTVRALAGRVRALRPGLPVHLGHIELNAPLLPDTLAALGPAPAVLVPLLLGRGHHVRQDIPAMAAAAPVRVRVAAPLGPHPLLARTLHDRLLEAGWPAAMDAAARRAGAVVLAAAGSRDPDSAVDTRRTARLLADRLGVPVVPAYASAAAPSVPAALRALAARGRHRVAVASYFTAPGRFAAQCAAQTPWLASAPLGAHEAMARLVLLRYDRARPSRGAELGGFVRISPGPRRPARHLAALSDHPSTPGTRTVLRLAMHRTGHRGPIRPDPNEIP